ncbi:right-handed parallel beta-helix repeat-containing protein [Microbispora cellulosiformans]|uniref:Right-handed parallel beta-helix repeat-containing protein n=1 Tax=Microbispora cellulosiformans TaxID=2614688 RepID=A0A5J5JUQ6_9ACTN|nr:right-handed parallel beta-helix repeat-containing protein [Microbispora cellulosiformans]KAA9375236.1 right-handed parallel beta-helix repeat-containing protein [Microbispora cellulosiformans]
MSDTPPRRSRALLVILVLSLVAACTWAYLAYTDGAEPPPAINDVPQAEAQQQSTLVDQESLRVMQTRATLSSALARGGPAAAQARVPHISSSANGQTLVLPQRRDPYRIADLERLGLEEFQKQSDGSFVLGINVFLGPGAKLVLQNAQGPLVIRMRSEPGAFVSIVGFDASIRMNGSAQNPVRITSWNPHTRTADTQVSDGRAYLRAIGGELRMSHTRVEYLGFWSGPTGGLALTGTDRPADTAERVPVRAGVAATPAPRTPGRAGSGEKAGDREDPEQKTLLPNGLLVPSRGGDDEVEITDSSGGSKIAYQMPQANLVTGEISDTAIVGNAYGVFISASDQTRIDNVTISDSLIHGVLLHRFARNASIENTTVTGSRGDGFVLSRGTQNVTITGSTAERNAGNGFTMSGLPLAQGPSASGESLRSFGGDSLLSSAARDNGRYGVEVQGGIRPVVQTTEVVGGEMGIVVSKDATGAQVSGNRVRGQSSQGIVLRDGVVSARVSGNIVREVPTAIYVRNSRVTVTANTVQSASLHAISVLGAAGGSEITGNTLGGAGRSALDTARATGSLTVARNNTGGWQDTAGFWTMVRRIAKPMNLIWFGVILLIAIAAIRALNGDGPRAGRRIVDPYEKQAVLEERPARELRTAAVAAAGKGD